MWLCARHISVAWKRRDVIRTRWLSGGAWLTWGSACGSRRGASPQAICCHASGVRDIACRAKDDRRIKQSIGLARRLRWKFPE